VAQPSYVLVRLRITVAFFSPAIPAPLARAVARTCEDTGFLVVAKCRRTNSKVVLFKDSDYHIPDIALIIDARICFGWLIILRPPVASSQPPRQPPL
jgi:hypothetical protein